MQPSTVEMIQCNKYHRLKHATDWSLAVSKRRSHVLDS